MLIDAVMFFDEFEILNLRLEELYDIVDEFVVVETDLTHNGKSKPFYLSENLDRINSRFLPKLKIYKHIHVNRDPNQNAWIRENEHRNAIVDAIKDYPSSTRVLMSDCDEIPSKEFIEASADMPVAISMQRFFYYTFDTHKKALCHGTISVQSKDIFLSHSPQQLRDARFRLPQVRGGWHLSYFGSPEKISRKISSFAHTEFNTPENINEEVIKERVEGHRDIFGRDSSFEQLVYNTDYVNLPRAYLNSKEQYRGFSYVI